MPDPSLGVLLRCHRRPRPLEIVLQELWRYKTELGIDIQIHCLADRPDFRVEEILKRWSHFFFCLKYAPYPLVSSSGGERFMEALNLQLDDFAHGTPPDWYTIADDDRIWPPPEADKHLRPALENKDVDAWYGESYFLWDSPKTYNRARHHNAIVLFRSLRGDRFPEDRVVQATSRRHDQAIMSGRVAQLPMPLLDVGTLTEEERRRVYDAFWTTGAKRDPYVASIKDPPDLAPLPAEWQALWAPLWE